MKSVLAVLLIAAAAACSDASLNDVTADKTPPTVKITNTGSGVDSIVAFSVEAKDNIGLKTVHVAATGGITMTFDTTFTSAITDVTIPFSIIAAASVPRGSPVRVTAFAVDGAGNKSNTDSLALTVGNIAPPDVKITSPASGTFAVIGKSIIVAVSGKTGLKVRSLGISTTGPVTRADSIVYNSPLRDSVAIQDTILIPATAPTGPLVLTPFLYDSLGTKTLGHAITVTVQTAAQSNSVPVVTFGLTPRIEVNDTIHVEATDQAGITTLGYEVRRTVGGTIDASDSVLSSGQITSAIHTFTMHLPYTTFPTTVFVQAFARNSNGTRAYAKLAGGVDQIDTVTVVAGVTRPLPFGGLVADALYHPSKDRLYLTNIALNRVEVFNLADSSFKTPINVGSRPWGIAAWPRDRFGTMGDTLLVANSGGTDISYVNLDAGATGAEANINYQGTLVRRYPLPNIIAYTITTVKATASSGDIQQLTKFDFSDRPQFLAATCKTNGSATCTETILAYTTTPTPGQNAPFANLNGTVRWENLTQPALTFSKSHFFYEQAIGQTAGRGDTLLVVRYDAVTGDSTVLVPYREPVGAGGTTISVVVDIPKLAFRDTTFTRNSGNFLRAVVAEGGAIQGSRAMTYDVSKGFVTTALDGSGVPQTLAIPFKDAGISDAANVSDFTANTFQQVTGAGINFDGSLSGIRGDSTYIINPQLRLQGTLPTTIAAGFDFHPQNTGPFSAPLSTRLAFAASTQPRIDIYDTNCYQLVGTIPIRDPIIGPIKAALRSNGSLMLIGATVFGVVIAELPNTFTTTCP